MRILILSAYNAVSHDHLNKGLVKYIDDAEITLLTLQPRFFAWRVKGNSLSFAFENRDELTKGYDLIFATSLTDITALRGFVPELASIPTIVYFHENQFDYPDNRYEQQGIEMKMTAIYNAIVADKVVFNTHYNMRSFLKGTKELLRKLPDHVPKGLVELIEAKSEVVHVPINPVKICEKKSDIPVILWNHRWEYDKAPERFLSALRKLKERTSDFKLNLAGQVFRNTPESYSVIEEEFSDHINHIGYAKSREEYEDIISNSNIIISTSMHDFQGLSVMEAADAGCIPVLPNRVAYTEIFGDEYLYAENEDEEIEAENCAELILHASDKECDMSAYYWENLRDKYTELFRSLI